MQNNQAIDECEERVNDVLDPDDRDAAAANVADQVDQRPAFVLCQAAGHLVEQKHARLRGERARQLKPLAVEENLLIGGQLGRAGPWSLPRIYELFPALAERRHVPSTSLSGGEQQMVALGRALMSNPKLLLCDEISLGLAPIVVREVYARLPSIVAEGSSLVIVEQDIVQALKAANHVYCLQEGRIALAGAAATLTREAISAAYFGA